MGSIATAYELLTESCKRDLRFCIANYLALPGSVTFLYSAPCDYDNAVKGVEHIKGKYRYMFNEAFFYKLVGEVIQDLENVTVLRLQQEGRRMLSELAGTSSGNRSVSRGPSGPRFSKSGIQNYIGAGLDPKGKRKLEHIDAGSDRPCIYKVAPYSGHAREGHHMLSELAGTSSCNRSVSRVPLGPRLSKRGIQNYIGAGLDPKGKGKLEHIDAGSDRPYIDKEGRHMLFELAGIPSCNRSVSTGPLGPRFSKYDEALDLNLSGFEGPSSSSAHRFDDSLFVRDPREEALPSGFSVDETCEQMEKPQMETPNMGGAACLGLLDK